MKIIGVIPARWASTRFEGKVLAEIAGKPMIQHVWEEVRRSKVLNDVIIACDDKKVLMCAQCFGARAVLTSPKHASGTDRIAEAVKNIKADIIVNIQGDEPLIKVKVVDELARALLKDKDADMATVIKVIEKNEELANPNVVKVVIDKNKNALYFSRSLIPFNRDKSEVKYYKHLGIYAYRKSSLVRFTKLAKSKLENIEKLEQLRALENGFKIRAIETTIETVGVDTPEDLKRVVKLMKKKRI